METIMIFTDAATSPQAEVAIGVSLCINKNNLEQYASLSSQALREKVMQEVSCRFYRSKKSTEAEIKTVVDTLQALRAKMGDNHHIELYTDCQSLCDLLVKRKNKLQENEFQTRSGKVHQHAALYKTLYNITSQFEIKLFKVKGHATKSHRVGLAEQIFDILDKLSRQKLRQYLNNPAINAG